MRSRAKSRTRIIAGERLAQAVRLLRDVLAMGEDVRGPFRPLLEAIHGLERLAEEVAAADTVDDGGTAKGDTDPPTIAEPYRDRLAWDANVSESSPVVRGTWVTVSHVVSLIVDGWTWADCLRAHPELTEDDIRACLAYTVSEETAS